MAKLQILGSGGVTAEEHRYSGERRITANLGFRAASPNQRKQAFGVDPGPVLQASNRRKQEVKVRAGLLVRTDSSFAP
jgi:hypothetical protein